MDDLQYHKESSTRNQIFKFARAYNKLSRIDGLIAQSIICKRAGIDHRQTFNAYKNGRLAMPIETIDIIKSVFRCHNIDAATGEVILKINI